VVPWNRSLRLISETAHRRDPEQADEPHRGWDTPVNAAQPKEQVPPTSENATREAVVWAQAHQGPNTVALSHETALAVCGISDANPAAIHLTIPKSARLRRESPKSVMVHRDDLPSAKDRSGDPPSTPVTLASGPFCAVLLESQDVTVIEGLPVTSIARTIADLLDAGGRLDLSGQAITEARREGYISAAASQRLRRELKRHVEVLRASGRRDHNQPNASKNRLARVTRQHGLDQERLRRWVSFLALCGVLERALQEQILDSYFFRATKDLDLGLEGPGCTLPILPRSSHLARP
jgi:hypothetical protein